MEVLLSLKALCQDIVAYHYQLCWVSRTKYIRFAPYFALFCWQRKKKKTFTENGLPNVIEVLTYTLRQTTGYILCIDLKKGKNDDENSIKKILTDRNRKNGETSLSFILFFFCQQARCVSELIAQMQSEAFKGKLRAAEEKKITC